MPSILAVIPARYASTRLAGKPLARIGDRPMVVRVLDGARQSRLFDRVVVATDDDRIEAAVREAGGEVVRTRADHPSGTDRVAEVASRSNAEIVVNVQGDLPFVGTGLLAPLVSALCGDSTIEMATLAVPIRSEESFRNPNVVKVVTDERRFALYFSRAPIPARRDPESREAAGEAVFGEQHVGIYGYRRDFLLRFTAWPPSRLEQIERLEQLRALERGVRIHVSAVAETVVEVDTAEDLRRAEAHATTSEVRAR